METKYKIEIPKPCHENWNQMTPDATGRFCGICAKSVVDFTNKTTAEIQNYFIENKGKSVCGRFRNQQLEKFDIHISQNVLQQKMSFNKAFLLVLFLVMGSSLFSCKNDEGFPLGEVVMVEDTIQKPEILLGMVLPPRDTIEEDKYRLNSNKEEKKLSNQIKDRKKTHCKMAKEQEDDENILKGDIIFLPKDSISK